MIMRIMISAVLLLFSCDLLSASRPEKFHTVSVNIDGIRYRVVSEASEGLNEAEILHTALLPARDEIFSQYDLSFPVQQNVTVTCGAHIFRAITGETAKAAAVYLPGRDEIVIQRPSALYKKQILDQVVRHELLHYAIAVSRQKAGISEERSFGLFWLEESFCTAAYPVGLYDAAKGKRKNETLGDWKKIKNYLEQFLRSENEREMADAYSSALSLGSDLISKHGKRKVFAVVVGSDKFPFE